MSDWAKLLIALAMIGFVIFVYSITDIPNRPQTKDVVKSFRTPDVQFAPIPEPEDHRCLALNIYHESRGESLAGRLAVAHVTLNRVAHKKFPDTVCGVVTQARYYKLNNKKLPVKNKCQFSWYCDGKSDTPKDLKSWQASLELAAKVLLGRTVDPTHGAIFYYNPTKADPYWSEIFVETARIDDHVFMVNRGRG